MRGRSGTPPPPTAAALCIKGCVWSVATLSSFHYSEEYTSSPPSVHLFIEFPVFVYFLHFRTYLDSVLTLQFCVNSCLFNSKMSLRMIQIRVVLKYMCFPLKSCKTSLVTCVSGQMQHLLLTVTSRRAKLEASWAVWRLKMLTLAAFYI